MATRFAGVVIAVTGWSFAYTMELPSADPGRTRCWGLVAEFFDDTER